jgi:hypothetical protein
MKKKIPPRKAVLKPPGGTWEEQPQQGIAGAGQPLDPLVNPKDNEPDETSSSEPHPAPAPGVPVSGREYERLKELAKTVRKRSTGHVQEDPSEKKPNGR